MRVLVINCGSSSLKFDVVDVEAGASTASTVARGSVSRIGDEARSSLRYGDRELERSGPVVDHAEAFRRAAGMLQEAGVLTGLEAIGHRVVHGGVAFRGPALIDAGTTEAIARLRELAPLHNGPALAAIEAARARFESTPMVATFDTSFYVDLPAAAALYALPWELSERLGIRRFGFHGIAHRSMVERVQELFEGRKGLRIVSLQLGNGCSVTASADGAPVDTSMGFTPLEGLIMGTRSGDIDPSIPVFLARQGYSPDSIDTLLNHDSGLLGLSGRSNDMQDLLEAEAGGDERAGLAIDAFCYRARKYVGAYLAALGGADCLVFGGGIGERSADIRRRICAGLEWTGLSLDQDANAATSGEEVRISTAGSAIQAWVLPVDEASLIAHDVCSVLSNLGTAAR
jgi:acetate kinase